MLGQLCDPELWLHPWIFKIKFLNSCISGMGRSINMDFIGCWTHYVTLKNDLHPGFWRSNFETAVFQEWQGWFRHETKGTWVDRKFGPTMWPELWPHPWLTDMEWMGYKTIGCWTHYVTLNYGLHLGFSRSNFETAVSQEWEGWLTWKQRDMSR